MIHIGQTFDLALIKTLNAATVTPIMLGADVTFDITVTNQGTLDATQIQVNEYIPTGLTLNDPNWTANAGVATLNTPIAALAAGASTTVSVTMTVDSAFQGTSITNNAEVASALDGDGNPAKDVDSTPNSEDGTTPDPLNDDTAATDGSDDYDSEVVSIQTHLVHIGNLVWIEDDNDGDASTGTITYPPAGTVVTATASDGTTYTGTTDASGHYDIEVPINDTYTVTVHTPSETVPTAGSDDDAVPDDTSENNKTHNGTGTTVSVGTTDNLTLDFGFVARYHVGTHFWIDGSNGGDNDGIYQEGTETPVANALVELLDGNGTKLYWTDETNTSTTTEETEYPIETKTTEAGEYGFDVPAGSYQVRFHMSSELEAEGYGFIGNNSNNHDDNVNIDNANKNGITQTVEVGPGHKTADLTLDAAVNCACAEVSSGASALGTLGLLAMILMTLGSGLLFIRREEGIV